VFILNSRQHKSITREGEAGILTTPQHGSLSATRDTRKLKTILCGQKSRGSLKADWQTMSKNSTEILIAIGVIWGLFIVLIVVTVTIPIWFPVLWFREKRRGKQKKPPQDLQ